MTTRSVVVEILISNIIFWVTDYCIHLPGIGDHYLHHHIDPSNLLFPSRYESNYVEYCHENSHLCLHCRHDGEKSVGHLFDHHVNRSGESDLFYRYDGWCLFCQNVGGTNLSLKFYGVKPFWMMSRKTEIFR